MPRHVFLDCGTHEGQGLEQLVSRQPSGCEVHCFEPNPAVVLDKEALLSKCRAAGNEPSSLVLHPCAVWDRDGFATFNSIGGFPRGTPNGRGQSSSISEVGQRAGIVSTNQVPCVDLLSFVRSLGLDEGDELRVKLDVEGAEFDALKRFLDEGDDVLASGCFKQLWIEWHVKYFAPGSWEKEHAVAELTERLQAHDVVVSEWE